MAKTKKAPSKAATAGTKAKKTKKKSSAKPSLSTYIYRVLKQVSKPMYVETSIAAAIFPSSFDVSAILSLFFLLYDTCHVIHIILHTRSIPTSESPKAVCK